VNKKKIPLKNKKNDTHTTDLWQLWQEIIFRWLIHWDQAYQGFHLVIHWELFFVGKKNPKGVDSFGQKGPGNSLCPLWDG